MVGLERQGLSCTCKISSQNLIRVIPIAATRGRILKDSGIALLYLHSQKSRRCYCSDYFISSRWRKMAHSLGLRKCRDNHQAPGFIVRKPQKSPVSSPWYSGTEAVMIRCSTFKSPISTSTMQATMESGKGEFVFFEFSGYIQKQALP